jgi:hypothetical protein
MYSSSLALLIFQSSGRMVAGRAHRLGIALAVGRQRRLPVPPLSPFECFTNASMRRNPLEETSPLAKKSWEFCKSLADHYHPMAQNGCRNRAKPPGRRPVANVLGLGLFEPVVRAG